MRLPKYRTGRDDFQFLIEVWDGLGPEPWIYRAILEDSYDVSAAQTISFGGILSNIEETSTVWTLVSEIADYYSNPILLSEWSSIWEMFTKGAGWQEIESLYTG